MLSYYIPLMHVEQGIGLRFEFIRYMTNHKIINMKYYLIMAIMVFVVACSNGTDTSNTTTTDQASPNTPVENVNGNVPDTINSVSPDNRDKTRVDSSYVDSTKK